MSLKCDAVYSTGSVVMQYAKMKQVRRNVSKTIPSSISQDSIHFISLQTQTEISNG